MTITLMGIGILVGLSLCSFNSTHFHVWATFQARLSNPKGREHAWPKWKTGQVGFRHCRNVNWNRFRGREALGER